MNRRNQPALVTRVPAESPGFAALPRLPWQGVQWTLTLAGFLLYVFVITSYRLGIADVAMAMALIGLLFGGALIWATPLTLLAAFVTWSAAGLALSTYPDTVRDEFIALAKVWLVSIVALNALRSVRSLRLFLYFFLAAFVLFPLRGTFINYFVAGYNVFGRAIWNFVFENPNDLAAIALLQLSVATGLVASERNSPFRVPLIVSAVLITVLIVMTQSRAGFLGLLAFAIGLLWREPIRRRGQVFGAVVLAGAALLVVVPNDAWDRVGGLRRITDTSRLDEADSEGSARQRYEIWLVAAQVSRDHPSFGVGLGAYPLAHEEAALNPRFDPTARGKRDTHSTYIRTLAETGVPGLLLFLGYIGFALVGADRIRRRTARVVPQQASLIAHLQLGLVAFLVAGVFGSFAYLQFLHIHIAVLTAAALCSVRRSREFEVRLGSSRAERDRA